MGNKKLIVGMAGLGLIGLASSAALAADFKDLPKCEQRIVATNKDCAIVNSIKQNGDVYTCYCDHKGNSNSRTVPFPNPVVVKTMDFKVAKIKPADDTNPDPCVTVTQGGTTYRVCW